MASRKAHDIETQSGFQEDRAEFPSRERVEKRARELARIRGRSFNEVNDEDREQARLELSQQEISMTPPDEQMADGTDNRDLADPPAINGNQARRFEQLDEQALPEHDAQHGKQQAEHDQMLEGQKRPSDLDDRA